jgi:hypothetical protein
MPERPPHPDHGDAETGGRRDRARRRSTYVVESSPFARSQRWRGTIAGRSDREPTELRGCVTEPQPTITNNTGTESSVQQRERHNRGDREPGDEVVDAP